MLHHAVAQVLSWRIETWQSHVQRSGPSRDAKLVSVDRDRIRLAVIGAHVPQSCRSTRGGDDEAIYAASMLRLALQRPRTSLFEAASAINDLLHDDSLDLAEKQTRTCLAAVDISRTGDLASLCAGLCRAWVRSSHEGDWQATVPPGQASPPSLGQAADAEPQSHSIRGVREVVLCSGGAKLGRDDLNEISSRLQAARLHGEDVTVIRAYRMSQ